MNKIIILLCLLLVWAVPKAQTIPAWKITDLEKWMKETDAPVIVSFWATWCKPCLAEIPYFERLAEKYKGQGVKLLMVSLDMKEQYPAGITSVVRKRKITAPVVWLHETNADYFCPKIDSSWSGSLPATLLLNAKKGHRQFFEEAIHEKKLEEEIQKLIGH